MKYYTRLLFTTYVGFNGIVKINTTLKQLLKLVNFTALEIIKNKVV